MMMTVDEVRERIMAAIKERERSGIKIDQIAKELGVSTPTLYRWRRGERIDNLIAGAVTLLTEKPEAA